MPYIKYLYPDINSVLDVFTSMCNIRSTRCNIKLFINLYDGEDRLKAIPYNKYYGRAWYPSIEERVKGNLDIESILEINFVVKSNTSSSINLDAYNDSGYTIGIVREWEFIHFMADGTKNTFHIATLNYRVITQHCIKHNIVAPVDNKDSVSKWLLVEINRFKALLELEGAKLHIYSK